MMLGSKSGMLTNSRYELIEELRFSGFTLSLRKDGIVQLDTDEDAYFTVKKAKEYIKGLEQITRGIPHLILKIPGKHASVDSETRLFMASDEALKLSIAEAVIIRNLAQRIIGNFYLKFDKPEKTVRLFTKVEDAVKWLRNYK
jgi:hypothetical protein